MNRTRLTIGALLAVSLVLLWGVFSCRPTKPVTIDQFTAVDRPARVQPDYTGTVIPPNIAPLNFLIREPGVRYCARISSDEGGPIEVFSARAAIQIPAGPWRTLLERNRGRELRVEVLVQNDQGRWDRFQPATNTIAAEDIDGFLVYRKMHPTHLRVKGPIGVYCRDLTTFKESTVLSSMSYGNGCLNCHAFPQNRGDKMLLGVRSKKYGVATLLVEDGSVKKIGAKFGYTSWHPSGSLAVYSVNNLPMFYHASRNEVRDTVDLNSFLAIYRDDTGRIDIEPQLARKERLETWPAWSADGRHLYFCSAPKTWPDDTPIPPAQYDQVKYDLMRIAYDPNTHAWGPVETALPALETGRSIVVPRCSPDGRWLSFCMCDYGYFPSWQASSDLYLADLKHTEDTGQFTYRRLDINSDASESWQTWSSNSRWLVFSSKRLHGPFTRLFISYVDASGTVHKPLVLPQQDPAYYDACLQTFNTPELLVTPPTVTGEQLARRFRGHEDVPVAMPITMATPTVTGTSPARPWQSQRE